MQNKRVFVTVWAQRSEGGARGMHDDLASCFVHDAIVNIDMKVLKCGHYGDEIGGILFVIEGRAIERGWNNIVDAVGGSIGKY